MKKLVLSIAALLVVSVSSAFGIYTATDTIDFLMDGDIFEARIDRLGANFGTENYRFAVGLKGNGMGTFLGNTMNIGTPEDPDLIWHLNPSAFVGFGYKANDNAWGVGVGYEFGFTEDVKNGEMDAPGARNGTWMAHTPVLMFNALNDNLRITVPFSIGMGSLGYDNDSAMSTEVQVRYYTGMDIFTAVRAYIGWGMIKEGTEQIGGNSDGSAALSYKDRTEQAFDLDLRFYFNVPTEGPVAITPFVKLVYQTALGGTQNVNGVSQKTSGSITSIDARGHNGIFNQGRDGGDDYQQAVFVWAEAGALNLLSPDIYGISVPLGLEAKSDIVTLYVEPTLSFAVLNGRTANMGGDDFVSKDVTLMSFGYDAYAELYITPVEQLELYLELGIGGATGAGLPGSGSDTTYSIAASSGIAWYF